MLNAFNTWTEKNTPAEFLRISKRLMKIECKPFCFRPAGILKCWADFNGFEDWRFETLFDQYKVS